MSALLEKLVKDGSVPLKSYGHQVGGHHLFFKFEEELCKPLHPREHFFYLTAPKRIKRYIPAYYGMFKVVLCHRISSLLDILRALHRVTRAIVWCQARPAHKGLSQKITGGRQIQRWLQWNPLSAS